jgi:hypothetical protein
MMKYLQAYPWNVRVIFLNLTDNQLNMYKHEFRPTAYLYGDYLFPCCYTGLGNHQTISSTHFMDGFLQKQGANDRR